jgi:hypothetical protein
MINKSNKININMLNRTLQIIRKNDDINPIMKNVNNDIIFKCFNNRNLFLKITKKDYFHIGEGYRTGRSLIQNYKYAFTWYSRAKNYYNKSNFYIGEDYLLGLSRDANIKMAKIHFKKIINNKSIYYIGWIKLIEEVRKPLDKRDYKGVHKLFVQSFEKGYEAAIKEVTMMEHYIK